MSELLDRDAVNLGDVVEAILQENESALKSPASKPNGKALEQLEPLDALALYNSAFDELPCVIPNLLFNGVTLFAGRPKVGKSWLTLHIGLAVAMGNPLWGKFKMERPGRVVYCALEEPPRRTANRLKKLVDHPTPFLQNLQFLYRIKPLLAGGADELDKYLTERPAELVVIDTLSAVVQAKSSRDVFRSDYKEVTTLRQLAEKHKTAILVVTHLRKMAADSVVDAVAGTTGVTAACDAIWGLRRQATGECLLEITGREMEEKIYALKFENAGDRFGWNLIGEGDDLLMSEQRREIIELLRNKGPMQPAKIADLLGKNTSTVRGLLYKMAPKGDVIKVKAGYCLPSHSPVNNVNEREG